MKYRFNYEKWYNNNAKIVEKSIELNAFQFERFYYEVHKRDGIVFCNNPDWNYYVGEILVDKNSIGSEQNVLVCINQCDCDLYDDSIEQEFNEGLAWFKEHSVPMRSPLFLDKDGLENTYGKSILSGVLPEANHVSVPSYEVDKVYPNEKKGVTCVIFKNGDKRILKVSKKEPYCVETAVAYAIAEQVYGSNGAFTKEVRKALPVVEGDEKKFFYDLWKKENKNQEDDIAKKYDGMTLSRIKETAESFSAYPNGMFVVDGEFCIDKKKEMK